MVIHENYSVEQALEYIVKKRGEDMDLFSKFSG
jgi:hypothetical protein